MKEFVSLQSEGGISTRGRIKTRLLDNLALRFRLSLDTARWIKAWKGEVTTSEEVLLSNLGGIESEMQDYTGVRRETRT